MSIFANGSGFVGFHTESADRSGWEISFRLHGDGKDITFHHLTKSDVQAIKNACTEYQKKAKETK